jgi:hypothetical protein
VVIEHSAFSIPRVQLKSALDNFRPGHMVFIIGPSGVGKTTMRHIVMREMFGKPAHWGRGRIPAIEAFAMLPHSAYFSSRELAKTLVEELRVPSLNWLLTGCDADSGLAERMRSEVDECADVWERLRPRFATEGDYWRVFQRSLAVRCVNHRDTSPSDHTLHLMSLAESSGVMFIMTGIHSVTRLWAIHSELRRRVIPVWMPPYSEKRKEDEVPYLRLLKTLCSKYTFSRRELLCTMANDILAATGGVFAEIIQLLERATQQAHLEGSDLIHKRHVEAAYYNDDDLSTLWRDIEAFEDAMQVGDVSKRSDIVAARWNISRSSNVGTSGE